MLNVRLCVLFTFLFAAGCADMSSLPYGDEDDPNVAAKSGLLSLNNAPGDDCAPGCVWSGYAVTLGAQEAKYTCNGTPCSCVKQGDIYAQCAPEGVEIDFGSWAEEAPADNSGFQVAGLSCGNGCIWSTFAVALGARASEADCGGLPCACVQEGNVWQGCGGGGSASTTPTPPPVSTPAPAAPAPSSQVPYFYQYDNSLAPWATCQNTSIAMVLAHYGWRGKPDDLTAEFGRRRAQSPAGLADVFNRVAGRAGIRQRATPYTTGTLDGMRSELDAGRPVIVHGYFTAFGHVLVVTGYDAGGYYVNDPAGKWSERFKGGYPYGGGSWSGADLYYERNAFEVAVTSSNGYDYLPPWYHAIR